MRVRRVGGETVMYSACLFCNGQFGSNDAIEHFPVGSRLAFDPWKGRLWVVCPHCTRWNLTPIEERFEAVEECERLFRETITRVSTDNVGLAVLRSGLSLVRIGNALRPEFAAWRYASRFSRRRNRARVAKIASAAGTGIAFVGTGGAIATTFTSSIILTAGPAIYPAMAAVPLVALALARDYLRNDRVVARLVSGASMLTVRARHASSAEIGIGDMGAATLSVPHDDGWATFDGTEAVHAATVILANSNHHGGNPVVVEDAVQQIEGSGSVEGFLAGISRRADQRKGRMLSTLGSYRSLGAMRLSLTERLALEMAVHEEAERRAMEGELRLLEEAWRRAEEIAAIADGILTPMRFPAWMTRWR